MKIKLLITLLLAVFIHFANAQTDFLLKEGYGRYHTILGIFKDDLFLTYKIEKVDYSSYYIHLAKFDGEKVSFIANPDSGIGITVNDGTAIFNNNLLFSYRNILDKNKLAVYNGNRVSLFNLPKGVEGISLNNYSIIDNKIYLIGFGNEIAFQLLTFDGKDFGIVNCSELPDLFMVNSSHFLYKNKNYFGFKTTKFKTKYAELVGSKLIFKNNFPSGLSTPTLFNNEIYFEQEGDNSWYDDMYDTSATVQAKYTEATIKEHKFKYSQIARFDGDKIITFKNLEDTTGLSINCQGFYAYNGSLYFFYSLGERLDVMAKFDGKSIILIKDTVEKKGYFNLNPFEFDNKLYFDFTNSETRQKQLLEFDGNKFKLIENRDSTWQPLLHTAVNFQNTLYFKVHKDGISKLAYLKNRDIKIVDNPDDEKPSGFEYKIVNYKGSLLFIYNRVLAKYNGRKIIKIKDSRWKEEE